MAYFLEERFDLIALHFDVRVRKKSMYIIEGSSYGTILLFPYTNNVVLKDLDIFIRGGFQFIDSCLLIPRGII